MTIPLYVPFFVLAALCCVRPPAWFRLLDWAKVLVLASLCAFWVIVALVLARYA